MASGRVPKDRQPQQPHSAAQEDAVSRAQNDEHGELRQSRVLELVMRVSAVRLEGRLMRQYAPRHRDERIDDGDAA